MRRRAHGAVATPPLPKALPRDSDSSGNGLMGFVRCKSLLIDSKSFLVASHCFQLRSHYSPLRFSVKHRTPVPFVPLGLSC